MTYQLIIDDREHKIIPYIKKYDRLINHPYITYKIERITIGDYVIMKDNIIQIVIDPGVNLHRRRSRQGT